MSSTILCLSVSHSSNICLQELKLVISPSPIGSLRGNKSPTLCLKSMVWQQLFGCHAKICTWNHLNRSALKKFGGRSICLESRWIVRCCDTVLLETIQCWVFKCSVAFDKVFLLHLIQIGLDYLEHCPNRQRNHSRPSPSTARTVFSIKIEEVHLLICFNWGSLIRSSHWGSSRNAFIRSFTVLGSGATSMHTTNTNNTLVTLQHYNIIRWTSCAQL